MRSLAAVFAAVAVFAAPLAAAAQIAPGTQLSGTLNQSIDSGSAQVGQPFTLSNVTATNGSGSVTGATIYGHVSNVVKAGQGRPGRVDFAFDTIRLHNGQKYALDARATQVKVQTKSNAGKEILGALGGMVAGNVLGKWTGIRLGGAAGAVGGYMLAKNNRQNVSVPRNSVMTVQVIRARRQA